MESVDEAEADPRSACAGGVHAQSRTHAGGVHRQSVCVGPAHSRTEVHAGPRGLPGSSPRPQTGRVPHGPPPRWLKALHRDKGERGEAALPIQREAEGPWHHDALTPNRALSRGAILTLSLPAHPRP